MTGQGMGPDQLSHIVCNTSDNNERQNAEAELRQILEQDPFAVIGTTTSPYTLVCSSVILVQIFKVRRHEGGLNYTRDFLGRLFTAADQLFSLGGKVPSFALRSLVTAIVKCQKLALDGWDAQLTNGPSSIAGGLAAALSPVMMAGIMNNNINNSNGNEPEAPAPCQLVQMLLERDAANKNNNSNTNLASMLCDIRVAADLIDECSKFDGSKTSSFMTFSAHRRASTTFRDANLRLLLPYTLGLLENVVRRVSNLNTSDNNNNNSISESQLDSIFPPGFLQSVVDLTAALFSYDFMAIIIDETEDSFVTQLPTDWRDILLESRAALDVLHTAVRSLPTPYCTVLLRAVIGLIGARRSFFERPEQKTQWLDFFMNVLMSATTGAGGRMDDTAYCGTLAEAVQRFLPPHTYACLAECPSWPQFLSWVSGFTRTMFAVPFGSGGSFQTTTTLMTFWNRLISSKKMLVVTAMRSSNESAGPMMSSMLGPPGTLASMGIGVQSVSNTISSSSLGNLLNRNNNNNNNNNNNGSDTNVPPQDIEEYVPELIRVFIQTRLTQVDTNLDSDAVDAVSAQTDLLPSFFSVRTAQCIDGVARMLCDAGEATIGGHPSTLVWACHTGACLVRSLVANVTEETCMPLAAFIRVICSCCTNYLRNRTPGSYAELEHAIIAFLTALQLVFAGARPPPNVTNLLREVFGEKHNLFQFLLDSVGSNIMSPDLDAETVDMSLDLIIEACGDLPTAQLMQLRLDIPPVVSLPMSRSIDSYKLRAKLYHALYIVRLPDPFGIDDFHRFLVPIAELMRSDTRDPLFVGGWLRDLRGVAAATANSEGAFAELLEWLFQNSDVFYAVASTQQLHPLVCDSLLKLLRQLVTPPRTMGNKLNIPHMCHSPAGLLLLQFCMRIIHDVMQNLAVPPMPAVASDGSGEIIGEVASSQADMIYEQYLKHVQTAMNVTRLCVTGDFCPFGAIQLYGDNRFSDAIVGIVRMMRRAPIKLIKEFNAVACSLAQMLSTLVQHHLVAPFLNMGPDEVHFVVQFALSVIGDTETKTSELQVALEYLAWVASTRPILEREDPTNGSGQVTFAASPRFMMRQARYLFGQKLKTLGIEIYDLIATSAMDIVTGQDRCLAQASACAYPIFDSDPGAFARFTEHLLRQYPRQYHREKVQQLLQELSADVSSQDRFFSKLVQFRSALRNLGL